MLLSHAVMVMLISCALDGWFLLCRPSSFTPVPAGQIESRGDIQSWMLVSRALDQTPASWLPLCPLYVSHQSVAARRTARSTGVFEVSRTAA